MFNLLTSGCFALLALTVVAALNPSCAPGGNFDLSIWELELPIGSPNQPDVIPASRLIDCDGFQDSTNFFTDKNDGAMVMFVPGTPEATGCVKWAESKHCRTEFHERSSATPWDPRGPHNRMSATLVVSNAGGQTAIGQVFHDNPLKPSAELYYEDDGTIFIGVSQSLAAGDQVPHPVGHVPLGQKFSYEIRYENSVLSIQLDDGPFITPEIAQLNTPPSTFKIGNYLQGDGAATVRFYDLQVSHSDSDSDSPGDDCDGVPSIVDPWVVNFRMYEDATCCKATQTTRAGTLDKCNNAVASLASFRQAVGQEMFGRNIVISMFEDLDCQGTEDIFHLTNGQQCWSKALPDPRWKSFKLSVAE